MTDTTQATPADDAESAHARLWLGAGVDGRTVRFWIAVAAAIAVVTLGLGALWVWGLNGPMAMDDMADMPDTDFRLPPVAGLYEGEEVFFVHPEASDLDIAELLNR